MSKIEFKGISKQYSKDLNILKDINIDITDGEFLVLLGPSGCGKSTLLRMLAGIEEVSSGQIFIDGICVNDMEPKDREVAMVFQNYALYPHMTVYENMAYGLKIKKHKKQDINQRIEEAAKLLKIEDLLKRYPSQLSGGQKQRVAIGRAIVKEPKVFLMDEPLSNLDAKLRNEMRIEIKKLYDKLGSTFIYVTHDQVEAVTLGHRIAIICGGEIIQIGSPFDVLYHPVNTFVASFVGTPQINYINGYIETKNDEQIFRIDNAAFSCSKKATNGTPDQNVIVGIRPEHCKITDETKNALKMQVDFCEIVGTEMLVHLKYREQSFVVKHFLSNDLAKNQFVNINIDEDKILLFDANTKKNLAYAS